jgi:hypothetical protein
MPQLIENKQNGPVLIENFEPTACAGNSAQKVETRTRVSTIDMQKRRHRAGKAARKVGVQGRMRRHRAPRHSSAQAGEAARHGGQAHVRFAQCTFAPLSASKQKVVLGLTTLFRISRVLRANTRIDVWILGGGA